MFYRVENDHHEGPYQGAQYDDFRSRMDDAHSYGDRIHPTPKRGGYVIKWNEVCAFRNMQQLFAWFGGWLPGLIHEGYHVAKMGGTVKFDDGFQVVIRPDRRIT